SKVQEIKKILIANRGEIARRIIATCRLMGIETVAVYADDDAQSPHCHEASEAYGLGSGPLQETYLNMDKILKLAQRTGAQAVHPGYGFLSEREAFARQVQAAGLIFIGPTPEHIALMGDKISSKKTIEKLGLP